MKYARTYAMLVKFGHSPLKAGQIVLDAARGDSWSLQWIRTIRRNKHSLLTTIKKGQRNDNHRTH